MTLPAKMRLNAVFAVLTGLCLRLLLVLKFPVPDSGDAPFYLELARNWLKSGVFGLVINGHLTPVDMRVPGYPAFLAGIFSFAGDSMRAVMLAQVVIDIATCLLIAAIAAELAPRASRERVALVGLWLAALCPFTANYTAVLLTETLVTFLTALGILLLLRTELGQAPSGEPTNRISTRWILAGIVVGLGTLVRAETPILLIAAAFVLICKWWRPADWPKLFRAGALLAAGLFLPLIPWAVRNWTTLHEVQFVAPRYSLLPGEFAPLGFNEWNSTWLWGFRDVYLVTWKLDTEPISVDQMPSAAFDSPAERNRVCDLFAEYNDTLTWSRAQDAALGRIARERTARHPLRTYLKIPLLRAVSMWFTPRVELLPYSGHLWPIRERWNDDPADVLVTASLALINLLLLTLAIVGAWIARGRPGRAFLVVFVIVRTAFFVKFGEAPEPRYLLECFPVILAFGAQVFGAVSFLRPAPDELSDEKSEGSVPSRGLPALR